MFTRRAHTNAQGALTMPPLEGKYAVITGANTGIGRHTALGLAEAGAHVTIAARSLERTQPVLDEMAERFGQERVSFVQLDLGSLDSVRQAAAEILATGKPIDLLINNAGLGGARGHTQDGFEIHFGVNHLGHFLWTNLLLDRIQQADEARIINVASEAHYKGTLDFNALQSPTSTRTGFQEYANSKLANVLFSAELARRLDAPHVHVHALHPGVVATDIWRRVPALLRPLIKLFMIPPEEGAQTTLFCAMSEEAGESTGLYWDACKMKTPSRLARDEKLARELWERSEGWVG
ncbi:SDR family NAD(P)-dependent oxidoreductase [Bradymonadaceae bacterium TMQ3]|nr:SDR family NAD(P)-dependent oxidoreductase [Bradymonadaceae bacterium TMQ3]TXC74494.1 SDR family oxidoreductase [Bradymonadales bacterium TMQ1]